MTSPSFRAIAFSGSLRNGSSNTALVRLAQRIAPQELTIEIIDWVDQLPWMNPDLETNPPEILQRWWAALRGADALIIGMPEYNGTPTALAKNAIDWATRPPADRAIAGTVVAFLSAAGRSGGQHSQDSVTPVLGFMGASIVAEPHVRLSMIGDRLDADGNTDDPEIVEAVAAKLRAIVDALELRDATPEQ
ncbi:MAG TPA: NAD(P)H-dependent oxidoreductase [Ilumatobacteraceae bacterium]|nr:NAD(P)H-dependent oxidoreductase [Ilumatobacteraceae bacterium]HRB04249.1 NAD(P)H-dependent oxidoreductase [Ilumatobacteraceae bacterium]